MAFPIINIFLQQTCQKSTPTEHDVDVDKPVTPPTEKVSQPQVASSSGLAAASSAVATPKRSPGRPPGSTIQVRLIRLITLKCYFITP